MNAFDYIIIGGGAAGCVMANRLTARSANQVLLIEAGGDLIPGEEPAEVRSPYPLSYYNPAYKWPDIRGHWRRRDSSPESFIEQGRVLGGSSSIMGMIALRGVPQDYDQWEVAGAAGWNWHSVAPYFRKIENDLDFDGPLHGREGPVRICRNPERSWPAISRAGQAYAARHGLPHVRDANADFRDGYCTTPVAASHTTRSSAQICYLDHSIRARPNLTVLTNAHCVELLFSGARATGAKVRTPEGILEFSAGEVILAAGTLQTPVLLQKAGIGEPDMLRDAGLEVRMSSPGVGRNLQNHPALFIGAFVHRDAEELPSGRNQNNTGFRYSSGAPDCTASDMFMTLQNRTAWHSLGGRVASVSAILNKPKSRGSVSLRPGDASRALIEFNFLDDPLDLLRMKLGFRRAADFMSSGEVQGMVHFAFPVSRTDRLRKLNVRTRANAVVTFATAGVLKALPSLGKYVFSRLVDGSMNLADIVENEANLVEHVRRNVSGLAHNVGTCRMGAANDRHAVVDPCGRVRGVDGLRVADASVMPEVPSGNTFLPTIMVAEKIAAEMLAER